MWARSGPKGHGFGPGPEPIITEPCVRFCLAFDTDGIKAGWGVSADEARENACQSGLATARNLCGPFRRRTSPRNIEKYGLTTWTDGDCELDSPEAHWNWTEGLDCMKVMVRGESLPKLFLALAVLLDMAPTDAKRMLRRLPVGMALVRPTLEGR